MPEIDNTDIQDSKPERVVSEQTRTPEEKQALYVRAFDMFMHDPRGLNIVQIAKELKMEPAALMRHSQNKGWEQMRLQQKSIISTVQNERRITVAQAIDERLVNAADTAIKHASDMYLAALDKISQMPLDPMAVPDDELEKDDHGNVKRRPKRAKLIEDKVFLLNQTMDGFMKMTAGAQGMGLVLNAKSINPNSTAEDLSKLTKLNVLLLNIQGQKNEKLVQELNPDAS